MKNNTKVLKDALKQKWILIVPFLILMALSASSISLIKALQGCSPTYFEIILEQNNDPQMILFPMMYIFLLISRGGENCEITKHMSRKVLIDAVLTATIYILFFIVANLLYGLLALNRDNIFNNIWSYSSSLSDTGLSPLNATLLSLLLMLLRFCFLYYLMSFINTFFQKAHWGLWFAFLISYIDYMLYLILQIPYPLGILPLEHTRIIYTEAYIPDFYVTGTRLPYLVSVIYWIGLISIVYLGFVMICKKRIKYEKSLH